VRLAAPLADGEDIYWLEGRPLEGGRTVVVRDAADGTRADAIGPDVQARTTVHEYGGGAYTVDRGRVIFANFADQRVYVDGSPITPEPAERWGVRYADFAVSPDGARVACVRETHNGPAATDVVNEIVVFALDGSGSQDVRATGRDFYSTPRWSPDGSQLSWLAWDHPNMPWDGTELFVDGALVAGGPDESIVQPSWSPEGVLHFASDRSGWWNLYRADRAEPLVAMDAEFAGPAWAFGMSWYAFVSGGRIACTWGGGHLGVIEADGALREVETPFSSISFVRAGGDGILSIAGSPTTPGAVVTIDLDTGAHRVLRRSRDTDLDPAYVSVAEHLEFPTEGGLTAFGYFYAPKNPDYTGPAGERPPLIVISHGGPTGATDDVLDTSIQYWTSRGFAVVDVDYGGSTGYGRAYRQRLNGTWGIVDVDDCVNAARALAARGDVDGDRLLIRGGSAGGYTTLCALVFRPGVFAGGASYYGVADAEALAKDTHKFESRYLDGLIGPYPEARDTYIERSPIHFADRIECPVIIFQGLEDAVVPPAQAEVLVAALEAKGLPYEYVPYEGEQHGFRKAENIQDAAERELAFYARILA
jgi:dipeptidyl aminopeptidase/acylaminoacyl peptidase